LSGLRALRSAEKTRKVSEATRGWRSARMWRRAGVRFERDAENVGAKCEAKKSTRKERAARWREEVEVEGAR
jgi:hypothetical protein